MGTDKNYGSGIPLASGFDLGAKSPLDSRFTVDTLEERNEHVTNNRAYDGMIVFVREIGKAYLYNGTEWQALATEDYVNQIAGNLEVPSTPWVALATESYADAVISSTPSKSCIHIGPNPPEDTRLLWISTAVPYNLSPASHLDRLKLNYLAMLARLSIKLNNAEVKLSQLYNLANTISSEHSEEAGMHKAQVSSLRSTLNGLLLRVSDIMGLVNNSTELSPVKSQSKLLRKETKEFLYSTVDLEVAIQRTLDQERGIIIEEGDRPSNPDSPIVPSNSALLTEDNIAILTEDGLIILVDGYETEAIPSGVLLTESGQMLMTEDGLLILLDSVDTEGITVDAILTEQGLAILTEDGRILLRG